MNWSNSWAESDQWELYNENDESHRLHVAQAGERRDHAWYALLYIDDGEHIDEQYDLGVRKEFPSKGDAIQWSDDYCQRNPDGHAGDIVEKIRKNKTG